MKIACQRKWQQKFVWKWDFEIWRDSKDEEEESWKLFENQILKSCL